MMREDDQRGLQTSEETDANSGQNFMVFFAMEDLLEKLKLLNYNKEFVKELKMMPLNKHYFAVQTNPGEQFYLFTSLAAWLIKKSGKPFEQPQEHDDPNSTITNILDALREIGGSVDFAPNRLKQGYGEHAVAVLDQLAESALTATNFKWGMLEPPAETEPETVDVEDDSEILLEKVEEEMLEEAFSEEEEENIMNIEDLTKFDVGGQSAESQKLGDILESNTQMDNWNLELEKVLPQLKVTVKTDSHDWRSRHQQMLRHRNGIKEALTTTQVQLEKLESDITQTLEKITTREKYLNNQLEPVLTEYRTLQDEFLKISQQYRGASVGVTERSHKLAGITEELEAVKQEMDERGSSMTDGTPLVNIKKAITKIKNEIVGMDVRIGVLEHSLLQARLRDKSQLQQDMNAQVYS